jgi:hypothetical protein
LSDQEILKVGLNCVAVDQAESADEWHEIGALAAQALGKDYPTDPAEDIYHLGMGKKVHRE